jgi:hypothetical protein
MNFNFHVKLNIIMYKMIDNHPLRDWLLKAVANNEGLLLSLNITRMMVYLNDKLDLLIHELKAYDL